MVCPSQRIQRNSTVYTWREGPSLSPNHFFTKSTTSQQNKDILTILTRRTTSLLKLDSLNVVWFLRHFEELRADNTLHHQLSASGIRLQD